MQRFSPYILLVSGLIVSFTAAYYSVFGLSKLFSDAALEVIIMASSLEFAKVIIVSVLYRFWSQFSIPLKLYLTTAAVILVIITSLGVYGYLSTAYEATSIKDKQSTSAITQLDSRLQFYNNKLKDASSEQEKLVVDINSLRSAMATTAAANTNTQLRNAAQSRRAIEKQLADAVNRRDLLDRTILQHRDSIQYYEEAILVKNSENEVAAELGPLKYLSRLTGVSMDYIINWFILLIVLVFDPLAISMLIAASTLLNNSSTPTILPNKVKKQDTQQLAEILPVTPIVQPEQVESEIIVPTAVQPKPVEQIQTLPIKSPKKSEPQPPTPVEPVNKTINKPLSSSQLKAMTTDQRKEYIKKLLK